MTIPGARIVEAGDSAVICEVEARPSSSSAAAASGVDVDANARAIAIAAAVTQRSIAGVRDVVPSFRSVTVFFDPLATDVSEVTAALGESMHAAPPVSSERIIDVPVVYGGDGGPDLADVAAFARISPEAVIERHAGRTYRVCMLGFSPGFAYMASVDDTIAMPRRETPRVRVPAGSVGIAGLQTGIYPSESPGGWQIIGRTATTLFDPGRVPPALFSAGDRVRFVPLDAPLGAVEDLVANQTATGSEPVSEPGSEPTAASPVTSRSVTVLQPGLLTTVQDAGRWGHQHLGVSVAGPMDYVAHRLANALVGNGQCAAALEVTWLGPELRMEQDTRVAVTGADLHATLNGADVPLGVPLRCEKGSVLRFGERLGGVRAYVAFDGAVAVPSVLGSRATHLPSGLGGVAGRQLVAGDRLALGEPGSDMVPPVEDPGVARPNVGAAGPVGETAAQQVRSAGGARLRVLPGPQVAESGSTALEALQRTRYTVSPESNRMGYRLAGDAQLSGFSRGDMISEATFVGGVQLPPSGDPILLMADRQTSGGYPQVAVVITADLPLAGQLGPGDWIEFEVCTRPEAVAALRDMDEALHAVG